MGSCSSAPDGVPSPLPLESSNTCHRHPNYTLTCKHPVFMRYTHVYTYCWLTYLSPSMGSVSLIVSPLRLLQVSGFAETRRACWSRWRAGHRLLQRTCSLGSRAKRKKERKRESGTFFRCWEWNHKKILYCFCGKWWYRLISIGIKFWNILMLGTRVWTFVTEIACPMAMYTIRQFEFVPYFAPAWTYRLATAEGKMKMLSRVYVFDFFKAYEDKLLKGLLANGRLQDENYNQLNLKLVVSTIFVKLGWWFTNLTIDCNGSWVAFFVQAWRQPSWAAHISARCKCAMSRWSRWAIWIISGRNMFGPGYDQAKRLRPHTRRLSGTLGRSGQIFRHPSKERFLANSEICWDKLWHFYPMSKSTWS